MSKPDWPANVTKHVTATLHNVLGNRDGDASQGIVKKLPRSHAS